MDWENPPPPVPKSKRNEPPGGYKRLNARQLQEQIQHPDPGIEEHYDYSKLYYHPYRADQGNPHQFPLFGNAKNFHPAEMYEEPDPEAELAEEEYADAMGYDAVNSLIRNLKVSKLNDSESDEEKAEAGQGGLCVLQLGEVEQPDDPPEKSPKSPESESAEDHHQRLRYEYDMPSSHTATTMKAADEGVEQLQMVKLQANTTIPARMQVRLPARFVGPVPLPGATYLITANEDFEKSHQLMVGSVLVIPQDRKATVLVTNTTDRALMVHKRQILGHAQPLADDQEVLPGLNSQGEQMYVPIGFDLGIGQGIPKDWLEEPAQREMSVQVMSDEEGIQKAKELARAGARQAQEKKEGKPVTSGKDFRGLLGAKAPSLQ